MAGRLTMVTANSAPVRRKQNQFSVISVTVSVDNTITTSVLVQAETDGPAETRILVANAVTRTGLAFTSNGELGEIQSASSPAALLADYNAFFNTAGLFPAKAAALEARFVATGRLPA
jgi:hypothetical protein